MNNRNELIDSIFKVSNSENISTILRLSEGKNSLLYLLYVSENSLTPSEISKRLNISRARVTVMLNSLSNENLIEFSKVDDDKRKMYVKLTNYGVNSVCENIKKIDELLTLLSNIIGIDSLERLIEVFDKLNNISSNEPLCD